MNTARWLDALPGDTKLSDIVIPGSHDAGVFGDMDVAEQKVGNQVVGQQLVDGQGGSTVHTRWCRPSWAKCQHTNLKGQALCGSRFFDLRIYVKQRTFWGEKKLKAGHFTAMEGNSWKEPSLGAYGGSLISLINDAVEFVRAYNSEFLILRFSHVKNHKLVREGIRAQLAQMGAFDSDNIYTGGIRNLGEVTLAELQGKVVMVFDSQFNSVRDRHGSKWMIPWQKLEDDKGKNGLHTCGIFKGDSDINQVKAMQDFAINEHKLHLKSRTCPDHLCCVYWQQTGGASSGKLNVKAMTTGTANSAHSALPSLILELLTLWGERGGPPAPPTANVISHDFVTPDTCETVIKMNPIYWGNSEIAAVNGR